MVRTRENMQTRIVDYWRKRHNHADAKRQHYHDRVRSGWEVYQGKKPIEVLENSFWNSPVDSYDGARVVETLTPQHVLGTYRNPGWFTPVTPTVPGRLYRGVWKSLLTMGWQGADMYAKSVEGVKYGNITGNSIYQTTWKVILGSKRAPTIDFGNTAFDGEQLRPAYRDRLEQHVQHNGVDVDLLDFFDVWFDPTGRGQYVIVNQDHDMPMLRYQNELLGGTLFDDKLLCKVTPGKENQAVRAEGGEWHWSSPGILSSSPFDQPSLMEQVQGIPDMAGPDDARFSYCWGPVPKDVANYDNEELPTQHRLHIIANLHSEGILVSDRAAPTPDLLPPVDLVKAVPVPFDMYGETPLTWAGPAIEQRNFIDNAIREETLTNLYPPMVIDEAASISEEDAFRGPNGILFVGGHLGRIQDAFHMTPRAPVLPEAFAASAGLESQMLRTVGATENAQGFSHGGRTSATEAAIIAQVGGGRFQMATMWLDETMKRKILMRMVRLYQTRMEQAEVVTVAGTPTRRFSISLRDLQPGVDIDVDSGLFGSLSQMQLGAAERVLSLVNQNPEMAARLKGGEFGEDLFYFAGFPRADHYFRSDDEMAQIAAQQEQQNIAAGRRGSALQGEVDTNREVSRGMAQRAFDRAEGMGLQGRTSEAAS